MIRRNEKKEHTLGTTGISVQGAATKELRG